LNLRSIAALDGDLFATNMETITSATNFPKTLSSKIDKTSGAPRNFGWPTCYFPTASPFTTPHRCRPQRPWRNRSPYDCIPAGQANDSVYGKQTGVASAGTNLTAGGGHLFEA